MPVAMERALKATAKRRGYGKKRTGAYVYGTMRQTGWRPSREKRKVPGAASAYANRRKC